MRFSKRILFLSVFLGCFAVYLLTLAPTVYWDDSAELTTIAYTLGIAHPNGYPTYTLLGHLFTKIPLGTIGFRVNLMSALFAALTAAMLYLLLHEWTKNASPGLLSAGIFAFSFVFWSQAVIAEVYTLFMFFIVTITYLITIWKKTNKQKHLYLLGFVAGLSLTHHLMILFLIPAFLYLFITKNNNEFFEFDKNILNKKLIIVIILLMIGLTPYLYLPIRSAQNPEIDWGNPETLENFITHVTAKTHRFRQFEPDFDRIIKKITLAIVYLILQFTITIFFSIVGVINFFKKKKSTLLFLTLMFLISFTLAIVLVVKREIADIQIYFLPTYMVFSIFIGLGIDRTIRQYIKNRKKRVITVIAVLFFILILNYSLFNKTVDQSRNYKPKEYIDYLFSNMEENSIFLANSDSEVFLSWYYQQVEGKRYDVVVIPRLLITYNHWQNKAREKMPEINFSAFKSEQYSELPISGEFLTFIDKYKLKYQQELHKQILLDRIINKFIEDNKKQKPIYMTSKMDVYDIEKYNNQTILLKKFS
ncbi:MAG: DUF2723 domain-containing protein [Nanoarchaeota archaeon]|nr:DUF2723 domain-containing protein [Nanoarchaeota archaeon]MBU1030189.1 DUF2723 domain-containing protein [Nanoarchaeota archaeon]MBU1849869.1 DUF2723 domain-containing protein [Nanoarchaeota archaeon]